MGYRQVQRMAVGELVRRWQTGERERAIARATGLSRNSLQKDLRAARGPGLERTGTPPSDQLPKRLAQASWSVPNEEALRTRLLGPHRAQLERWLQRDQLQLSRVHERLPGQRVTISYWSPRHCAQQAGLAGGRHGTVRLAQSPPPPSIGSSEKPAAPYGSWRSARKSPRPWARTVPSSSSTSSGNMSPGPPATPAPAVRSTPSRPRRRPLVRPGRTTICSSETTETSRTGTPPKLTARAFATRGPTRRTWLPPAGGPAAGSRCCTRTEVEAVACWPPGPACRKKRLRTDSQPAANPRRNSSEAPAGGRRAAPGRPARPDSSRSGTRTRSACRGSPRRSQPGTPGRPCPGVPDAPAAGRTGRRGGPFRTPSGRRPGRGPTRPPGPPPGPGGAPRAPRRLG